MYVQRLAEKLAANGHDVTVLTSQYDASLPKHDELNGVKIVRCWVAFRVSKGVIMPGYLTTALSLMRNSDVVVVNLPNTPIEAFVVPFLARFIVRKPITAIYHSDVHLPPTFFNKIVDKIVFLSNYLAASMVHRISAYTEDFARHSHILSRFLRKITVIPPPVMVEDASDEEVAAFQEKHAPNGEKLIGFTARFATEKGVEFMVDALEQIHATHPNVKVLFAGEYQNVIGEDAYWQKLQPQLTRLGASWSFLGLLNNKQLAVYYRACDVTVLPSINSTETFGLVQVESMLCGTPSVASNLPGVRQPVTRTGMGIVVPIGDSTALAQALIKVIDHPNDYFKPREEIEAIFGIQNTLSGYERFFADVIAAHGNSMALGAPKE
jgi:glycosyltransferase involved in cell wall biosynthesis